MNKPLSDALNPDTVDELRELIASGRLAGITFEHAMKFILTDGILPASRLPVAAFLALDDWARAKLDPNRVTHTTTELKNKTGELLDAVLRGKTVILTKHNRPIAELRPLSE